MSLDTHTFGNALKELGFTFFSGVPCSFLTNLINYSINECDYVMASNEGDAVATASGAMLAGKKSVALMQNSGLTNATSPLTSLNYSFQLPILGFVSLRGEKGIGDEPQHELMGEITEKMLDLMQVKWAILSDDMSKAKEQLDVANKHIENNETFFFVVRKGTFDKVELKPSTFKTHSNETLIKKTTIEELPMRMDILKTLSECKTSETLLLATTGKSGRELYEIEDAPNNLYMVGSMGCISSLALGLAKNTSKKVIAIDGDGALLMRMGNLPTNAYYAPDNFLHILIDNNMHDSTGGQFTLSTNVDFCQIAASSGYKNVRYLHSLQELEHSLKEWQQNPKQTFLYIKAKKGTKENLGRPQIKPHEVKERFMEYING